MYEYVDVRDLNVNDAYSILNKAGIKIYKMTFEDKLMSEYDSYGMIIPDTVPEEILEKHEGNYSVQGDSSPSITIRVVQDLVDRVSILEDKAKKDNQKIERMESIIDHLGGTY